MFPSRAISWTYWLLTVALSIAGTLLVIYWTPNEATMGPVQKIFYLHMPVAISAFLACLVVFIASIGYLWQRTAAWDDLAHVAAKVAVVCCSVVLVTGSIWGHSAWTRNGQRIWWDWQSPRMVFSLLLWLLYIVYLVIRPSIESRQRRALVSAVYGIVAFLDVPLVYLSTRLIPDPFHPPSVPLEPRMQATLAFWFIPVLMLAGGLIYSGFKLERRIARAAHRAEEEAEGLSAVQGGAA